MAAPEKEGCRYFPVECDFFSDSKVRLVRAECGTKAECVLLRLWCAIYADKGWYLPFGDDDAALLSESMGGGFGVGYIKEVVSALCKRGIFDGAVFAKYEVLTSQGIQMRYLEIKNRKKTIPVISEYWLLDMNRLKAESEQLVLKLHFFSINPVKTDVHAEITAVNDSNNEQSKGKERKPKKRKAPASPAGSWAADFARGDAELEQALLQFADFRAEKKKPLTPVATTLLCHKLTALADGAKVKNRGAYMCQVLEKSILSGWTGVFALDDFTDSTRPTAHRAEIAKDRPVMIPADADFGALF